MHWKYMRKVYMDHNNNAYSKKPGNIEEVCCISDRYGWIDIVD
jgi:hypothetical protein